MESHNVCEVTDHNLKLAALILCIVTMFCSTYLIGKYIDYKIAADQQTTSRMISFDQRCATDPTTCKSIK